MPESTTFPLLVDEVRRNEWFFDDTINGHRDGAVITKDEAYIYANCRTFDIYADPRYVTYDLITKKLDRW